MHRPTIAHAPTGWCHEQLLVGYRPTIAHALLQLLLMVPSLSMAQNLLKIFTLIQKRISCRAVLFLSKTSKVIPVFSICTDHKGESLKTQRTPKSNQNNLKFNLCSQWSMINLFLNEPPKKVEKKSK
jgi:hypothetical protein